MKLSVVATLYRSEAYIAEFNRRMNETIQPITEDYEIIFVNDGSPDNSCSVVENLILTNKKIKLIDLSRNFGHHQAMMAGLDHAVGDYVFLIDSDLEEAPESLASFWNEMMADPSFDVVYGVQEKRKGKTFERISGHLFYTFFNYFSGVNLPRSLVTSRLMSQKYVDSLRKYGERELVIAGIWHTIGFKQKPLTIKKGHKGKSTYSFLKKIEMMTNAIISFSEYPLILIFRFGVLVTIGALVALAYIIIGYLFSGHNVAGWRSLIVSVWFFGGITIMCLGIIGRYVGKIFTEVKQRPRVVIKRIVQG